nr:flagellar hook-length control protein FliK [Diaminobutyricibacter tongyongensis]
MATNPDAVTGTPTDARPTGATAAAPTTPVAPAPLADATQEPSIATSAPIPAALQPAPISGRTDTGRATAPAGPSAAVPAAVVPLPASAESGAPAPAASAAPSKATPSTPAQDLSLTAVAQATAQAAPAAPPTVTVAPAPPTASAAPTPPAFHVFAGQVARPVFTLAAAGDGNHTMTISVTPDNLGPVTVRAHISGENVRIELFSPSDNGRDALRQLLPDLRRDLSATGANANVDLSSQGRPDAQPNTGTPRDDPRGRDHGGNRPRSPAAASAALSVTPANLPPVGSPTGLDVLA